MALEEFVHNAGRAVSTQSLFDLYRNEMAAIGFDRIVFSLITDHPEHGYSSGHGIMLNYPSEWMRFYSQKGYELIDPVRHKIYNADDVFTWASLHREHDLTKAQTECLRLADDAGLHDGIGVPLRGPRGELAGIGAASNFGGVDHHADVLGRVGLLSHHFYTCFRRLERKPEGFTPPSLSDREREALAWYALGKNKQEIGSILHLSAHTVSNQLRTAQRKLAAPNMVAAVSRALKLGLIEASQI